MKTFTSITTKILISSFLLLAGLVTTSVASAEVINSFTADVTINEDSSVSIIEEIQYDFEESERHGIFRDIPVSYETDTGNRRIFLEVTSVSQDGEPAQFEMSWEGDSRRIRIGDPDVTISGEHTYEITYKVRGALNYFDEFDELYWNVTGNGWEVPINQAEATVSLPGSVSPANIQSACYSGQSGSDQECANQSVSTSSVTANAENLQIREGLTVAVGFPKNVVTEPESVQKLWWWLSANPFVVWPFLVFFISFYVWQRWGRDPEGRGAVVTQYEPPENLKPILVGALIDETVHMRDITAGIIYLAEQGFIEIERIEKKWFLGDHDYWLRQLRPINDIPDETYRHLAKLVFTVGGPIHSIMFSRKEGDDVTDEVKLSKLKESQRFVKAVKKLKQDIMQDMRDRGWFAPQNNKASLTLVGIIILTMAMLFVASSSITGVSVISGFIAIGIAIAFLALMKKKTKEGAILQEKLEGFKKFLSMTQKERLDFHNAPERRPQEFMEYLPYAVALGVEKKWAEQFKGMDISQPNWYHGQGAFTATDFASDLSSFSDSYNQAASGGSGSSGGGSSGGGMGGGGGGSW